MGKLESLAVYARLRPLPVFVMILEYLLYSNSATLELLPCLYLLLYAMLISSLESYLISCFRTEIASVSFNLSRIDGIPVDGVI